MARSGRIKNRSAKVKSVAMSSVKAYMVTERDRRKGVVKINNARPLKGANVPLIFFDPELRRERHYMRRLPAIVVHSGAGHMCRVVVDERDQGSSTGAPQNLTDQSNPLVVGQVDTWLTDRSGVSLSC